MNFVELKSALVVHGDLYLLHQLSGLCKGYNLAFAEFVYPKLTRYQIEVSDAFIASVLKENTEQQATLLCYYLGIGSTAILLRSYFELKSRNSAVFLLSKTPRYLDEIICKKEFEKFKRFFQQQFPKLPENGFTLDFVGRQSKRPPSDSTILINKSNPGFTYGAWWTEYITESLRFGRYWITSIPPPRFVQRHQIFTINWYDHIDLTAANRIRDLESLYRQQGGTYDAILIDPSYFIPKWTTPPLRIAIHITEFAVSEETWSILARLRFRIAPDATVDIFTCGFNSYLVNAIWTKMLFGPLLPLHMPTDSRIYPKDSRIYPMDTVAPCSQLFTFCSPLFTCQPKPAAHFQFDFIYPSPPERLHFEDIPCLVSDHTVDGDRSAVLQKGEKVIQLQLVVQGNLEPWLFVNNHWRNRFKYLYHFALPTFLLKFYQMTGIEWKNRQTSNPVPSKYRFLGYVFNNSQQHRDRSPKRK